jgi:hypothetical protein
MIQALTVNGPNDPLKRALDQEDEKRLKSQYQSDPNFREAQVILAVRIQF